MGKKCKRKVLWRTLSLTEENAEQDTTESTAEEFDSTSTRDSTSKKVFGASYSSRRPFDSRRPHNSLRFKHPRSSSPEKTSSLDRCSQSRQSRTGRQNFQFHTSKSYNDYGQRKKPWRRSVLNYNFKRETSQVPCHSDDDRCYEDSEHKRETKPLKNNEEEISSSPPIHTILIDNEQYTKVQTPRQEMIFKKSSLDRRFDSSEVYSPAATSESIGCSDQTSKVGYQASPTSLVTDSSEASNSFQNNYEDQSMFACENGNPPLAGVVMQTSYPGGPMVSVPVHWAPFLAPGLVPGDTALTTLDPALTHVIDPSQVEVDPAFVLPIQHDSNGQPVTVQVKLNSEGLPIEIEPSTFSISLSTLQPHQQEILLGHSRPEFVCQTSSGDGSKPSQVPASEEIRAPFSEEKSEIAETRNDTVHKESDDERKDNEDSASDSQYASMSETPTTPATPSSELCDSNGGESHPSSRSKSVDESLEEGKPILEPSEEDNLLILEKSPSNSAIPTAELSDEKKVLIEKASEEQNETIFDESFEKHRDSSVQTISKKVLLMDELFEEPSNCLLQSDNHEDLIDSNIPSKRSVKSASDSISSSCQPAELSCDSTLPSNETLVPLNDINISSTSQSQNSHSSADSTLCAELLDKSDITTEDEIETREDHISVTTQLSYCEKRSPECEHEEKEEEEAVNAERLSDLSSAAECNLESSDSNEILRDVKEKETIKKKTKKIRRMRTSSTESNVSSPESVDLNSNIMFDSHDNSLVNQAKKLAIKTRKERRSRFNRESLRLSNSSKDLDIENSNGPEKLSNQDVPSDLLIAEQTFARDCISAESPSHHVDEEKKISQEDGNSRIQEKEKLEEELDFKRQPMKECGEGSQHQTSSSVVDVEEMQDSILCKQGFVMIPILTPYYDPSIFCGYPLVVPENQPTFSRKKKRKYRKKFDEIYLNPEMYIGEPYMATPNGYLMPVDPQQMCQVHYYYPSNFYPPHVVPDESLMPIDVQPPSPYFREYGMPYYTTPQTYSKRPIKSRFSRLHEDERRQLAKTLANEKCISKKTSDGDDSGVSELEDQNCSSTRLFYEEAKPTEEAEPKVIATDDDEKPNGQKMTKSQKQKKKDVKKKGKKIKEPKALKNVIEIQEPDFSSFPSDSLPFKSEVTPKVEAKKPLKTSKKSNKNQKKAELTNNEPQIKEREKNKKKTQKNKRYSKTSSSNNHTCLEEIEFSHHSHISSKNEEITEENKTLDLVSSSTNKEKRSKSLKNTPNPPQVSIHSTQERNDLSTSSSCLSSFNNSIKSSQSLSHSRDSSNIAIEKNSRKTELKLNTAKSTKKQNKKGEIPSVFSSNCEMIDMNSELHAIEENVSNSLITELDSIEENVSNSLITELDAIEENVSNSLITELDAIEENVSSSLITQLDEIDISSSSVVVPETPEIDNISGVDSKPKAIEEAVSEVNSKPKPTEEALFKADIPFCSQTDIFEGNEDSVVEQIPTSSSAVVVSEENRSYVKTDTYMTELKNDSLPLNSDQINNNIIGQELKDRSTLPNNLENSDLMPRRFSELGVTEAVTKWVQSVTPEKAFLVPLATTLNKEISISESQVNSSDDEQVHDDCSPGKSSSSKGSSLESTPKNVPDNSSYVSLNKEKSADYNGKTDFSSTPNRLRRRSRQPRKTRRSSKPSLSSLSPLNDSSSKIKLKCSKSERDSASHHLLSDLQASDSLSYIPPGVRELPFSSEGRFYSNPLNQFISLTSEAKPLTLPLSSSTLQVPRVVSPVLINRSRSPGASDSSRCSPDLPSNSISSSPVILNSRSKSSCQKNAELASSDPLPLCSLM